MLSGEVGDDGFDVTQDAPLKLEQAQRSESGPWAAPEKTFPGDTDLSRRYLPDVLRERDRSGTV